jgi:hypothetical protein
LIFELRHTLSRFVPWRVRFRVGDKAVPLLIQSLPFGVKRHVYGQREDHSAMEHSSYLRPAAAESMDAPFPMWAAAAEEEAH